MRTKNIITVIIGQSNERGKRRLLNSDNSIQSESLYGAPVADPIAPAELADPSGVPYGSWWPKVAEAMGRRGIWMHMANHAIGDTGWVIEWCGTDDDTATGTVQESGDGNFDPNGYLAAALTTVQIGTFDERWIFMSSAQSDSSDNVTLLRFTQAQQNIVQYFLDNGIKVALGFSLARAAGLSWYANNGDPGWAAALSSFSGNSNVIAGANLYRELGTNVATTDGVHLAENAYPLAEQAWIDVLITGGW